MQLTRSNQDFLKLREKMTGSIGLVPTMGNLHQGHLRLIEKSLTENFCAIVTIFVNPKQFGPNEDFKKYPRTLEDDCQKIKEIHRTFPNKELIVYVPYDTSDIFSPSFATEISVKSMTQVLCGKLRPGHFDGVTTVVYQLFQLSRPQKAYFGEKDYQQFKIIERMTLDLRLPIQLVPIPIERDHDGLALSSRNQYLNQEERVQALKLPQTLDILVQLIQSFSIQEAFKRAKRICLEDPSFQYLEILDAENLGSISQETQKLLIAGALFQGTTRLIDNRLLSLKHA